MVRFTSLTFVLPLLASLVVAAPINLKRAAAPAFQLQSYAQFQISDGTTGTAQAQAAAIFIDPFNGVDLATVDSATQANIETMRQAAENAETAQFNPQIAAAGAKTAAGIALQNGKIKNKVLKLTAEVQGINIKIAVAKAAGQSTTSLESQLTTETTKLNTNIATDTKNAGQASKGVA